MSLLLASDLSAANSSKSITCLTNDMDDAKKLIASVENFISSSPEVLKGDSFDAVRSHMKLYVDALNKRVTVAENIISAMKSANSKMLTYMDGEPKLDTAERETVKGQMDAYNSAAANYRSRANNYDSLHERISREKLESMAYDAEQNAKKMEKKLKLIDNLDSTDSAAYSAFQSATDGINGFKNDVGGINTIKV